MVEWLFSGSWSRRRYLTIALSIAIIAVLLAVGCIEPGYVPNSDITVVKLTPNGTLEWSKLIDSGGHDTAEYITSTSDGGFVISAQIPDKMRLGGRYPYLMKFSSDGKLLWNRSVSELNCGITIPIENRNKEIVTVGGKDVCWFSPQGDLKLNRTILPLVWTMVTETSDGGYVISGHQEEMVPYTKEEFLAEGRSITAWTELCGNKTPPENPVCAGKHLVIHTLVAKLDQSGNVLWQESLRRYGFSSSPTAVIELRQGPGYVLLVKSASYMYYSVRLDRNGTFIDATPLDSLAFLTNRTAVEKDWKYSAIPYYSNEVVLFNEQGNALAVLILNNASEIISHTDDGGYISAGGTTGGLSAIKFHPDGSVDWTKRLLIGTVGKVRSITQTSDGGYAVICENDKGKG